MRNDRIAEPRRRALVPGWDEVTAAMKKAGAFGWTLAGAGPTILALSEEGPAPAKIAKAAERAFRALGVDADATRPRRLAARRAGGAGVRRCRRPLSRLSCLECGASYGIEEVLTECPACGGLLEVLHDLALVRLDGAGVARPLRPPPERASGPGDARVREERRLALPRARLPALAPDEIVSKPEGSTNLYRCVELGKELGLTRLFVKHEGENPTLSFKDRGMTVGVSWARHLGRTDVVCASTGDTSAALASYAAEVPGMRAVVLLPEAKITGEQLSQALHHGALTLGLATDFDGCMRIVADLARTRPVYLLNSKNPVRIEGQKTIGQEAIHDLGWEVPDWFVVPVGNAGNVSAIGKGIREWLDLGLIAKRPRIAGAQAEAADPFYRSWLGPASRNG